MATKTSSTSQKEHYKRYKNENRWEKNKVARLRRHLAKYPNDEQTKKALGRGSFTYNRNKFLGLKKVKQEPRLKPLPVTTLRKSISQQFNEF